MPDTDIENPNVENLLAACERDLKSGKSEIRLAAVGRLRTFGDDALPLLVDTAKSRDVKVSEAAIKGISEMGEAGTQALRDLFYNEIRNRKKTNRTNFTLILMWLLSMVLVHWLEDLASNYPIIRNAISSASPIFAGAVGAAFVRNNIHIKRGAISALQNTDDVRLIGLFALCLNEKDREIRWIAKNALIKLLPGTTASDAQHINKEERQALTNAIHKQKGHPKFMLALLKGLEQIGDERALPNVSALIREPDIFPVVRQAARDCLPYLQVRAEQAQQAQTLLRASSGSEIAPQTLLRPAQGVSSALNDAQELLRPKI